jgi:hypothetical protein
MGKQGLLLFMPSELRVTVAREHATVHYLCRTFLLFKSRVEISFKGEGHDTPSVTVIDTVSLQYPHHVSTII